MGHLLRSRRLLRAFCAFPRLFLTTVPLLWTLLIWGRVALVFLHVTLPVCVCVGFRQCPTCRVPPPLPARWII